MLVDSGEINKKMKRKFDKVYEEDKIMLED